MPSLSPYIMILGSTVPTSATGKWLGSVAVKLDNDIPGNQELAIVSTAWGYGDKACAMFIQLGWKGDSWGANLDQAFVPRSDRMVQIIGMHIQVAIDDLETGPEIVTTDPDAAGKPGMRYMPDYSLMCQYALGRVEVRDLLAAASAHVERTSLESRLAELEVSNQQLQQKVSEAIVLEMAYVRLGRLWEGAANSLKSAIEGPRWGRKGRIAQTIRSFPTASFTPGVY